MRLIITFEYGIGLTKRTFTDYVIVKDKEKAEELILKLAKVYDNERIRNRN